MFILQIEHPVKSIEGWKQAFDSDPLNRRQSGVQFYRILRPVDDPNFVIVELEFASRQEAEALLNRLGDVWKKVEGKIIESARARIVEVAESVTY